jgi:hypothetical protein
MALELQFGILSSVPGGMTVGSYAIWCSSRRLCQQRLRAAQAGVLDSVPCGMTCGYTPSGVPPGVSASNGFEAPRPGVSPVSLVA